MPDGNVEILRTVLEAFNRRDLDALSALLAPDVEIVPIRAALEGNTAYAGRDAAAEWFAALDESWETMTASAERFREGHDCVIAIGRAQGRGRESGVQIDVDAAAVARFRGGLVTHLSISTDVATAMEAAGLSE
jgi:ketosteroid isomerase-like protein